ncbi:MAG: hypothetical protein U0746_17245 [Gemmataceae bacterium]
MTGAAAAATDEHTYGSLTRVATDPGVRALVRSPLFWAVFVLKLIAGSVLASSYLRDLFAPFVDYFVESGFANPWDHFAALGQWRQFPYPPVMLDALAVPRALFGPHLFAYRLPLITADIAIALLLASWFPQRVRVVLLAYWCSPLVFYIQYWHGQLDLLPTALLFESFYFLRRRRELPFAALLGLALATKAHLWVAVPFLAVYLHKTAGWRAALGALVLATLIALAAQLPYLPSEAYRRMVYGSEEQLRVLALRIPLGRDGPDLLLAPVALALLWLRFASYPKVNWDLLMAYLGLVFGVFVLLAPPRPGYVLWSLPFVAYYCARQNERRFVALHVYTLAYFAYFWTGPESDLFDAWKLVAPTDVQPAAWLADRFGVDAVTQFRNLAFAAMFAGMTAVLVPMYLNGVRSNRVYRMRTKPLLIGMAGDSGAGKDTACELLRDVLGTARTLVISGDDYHRWPRGHAMWQVHTHLDVRANDLMKQQNDAVAIAQGQGVLKGTYDHATGRFTNEEWVDPRTCVIFAGLHTLALESQRRLYELTVFIDPDESLRRYWKVQRDRRDRGYSAEQVLAKIAEREADRTKYILPQADEAELTIRFCPAEPLDPVGDAGEPPLALEVVASNGFSLGSLAEALRGCGLAVDHDGFVDARRQRLVVSGSLAAAKVAAVAQGVVPSLDELTERPQFAADLNGVVQLALLVCLSDKARWGGTARRWSDG